MVRNRPVIRFRHNDSLPRNLWRRAVTMPPTGVSRYDRWTGARMYGSSGGRFSLPTTEKRNKILHRSHRADQQIR